MVAFFLRAYRLADKNIWWDEGWSVWLSQKDLAWIALRTAADEHPPLHYWMLHFWNLLAGTGAFAGRFISLAFGVLTIALLYRIGKHVGTRGVRHSESFVPQDKLREESRQAGLETLRSAQSDNGAWIGVLAALFLATARFHVWWSQDIKNYTPSIFFAFAAVWFGLQVIASHTFASLSVNSAAKQSPQSNEEIASSHPSPSLRTLLAMTGYAVFAALAMWTHYLAALVLLALNVYWLFVILSEATLAPPARAGEDLHQTNETLRFAQRDRKTWLIGSLGNWFIANLLAAALFAPWMYLYLQNAAAWSAAPAFDFSLFLKLVATVLPLGVTTNIDNYAALTIALTLLAAIPVISMLYPVFRPRSLNTEHGSLITDHWLLLILIVALPPILLYALSLTPVSFFAPKIQARYLLVLSPAYVMLLALGIATLKKFSIYLALAATLFVLTANAFVLNEYYGERRLTDDYATLTNTINSFARQGDVVLLDTDQEWPTFLYYLRAPLEWVGAPNGKPMDTGAADALAQQASVRGSAVWLVTIPDALATDPQHLLETRLAGAMGKQYERTVGDKRLTLYAPTPRDFVNVTRGDFAPQYPRAEQVDANAQLVGFDLPVRELNAGDTLRLVTYWSAAYPAMVSVRVAGLLSTTLQMPAGDLLRYENDFAIPPDAVGEFAVAVNQITLARVRIAPRAAIANAVSIAHPVDYRFGDAIHLVGYDLPVTNYRAGDSVPITLYWRADRAIDKSYTAFVHIVGTQFNPVTNNPLWGQIDRVPRDGAYPTTAWLPNEIVPDAYRVPIDPRAPTGTYNIEIGLYDPATGVRLPVDAGGDSVVVAEISVN
ncbi:MAG TPA: glycosyltransferase family 39 protein [Anaerolineae bacterium]